MLLVVFFLYSWKYFVTVFKDYFFNKVVNSVGYSVVFGWGGGGLSSQQARVVQLLNVISRLGN